MTGKLLDKLTPVALILAALIALPFVLIAVALVEEHTLDTNYASRLYGTLGILEQNTNARSD